MRGDRGDSILDRHTKEDCYFKAPSNLELQRKSIISLLVS